MATFFEISEEDDNEYEIRSKSTSELVGLLRRRPSDRQPEPGAQSNYVALLMNVLQRAYLLFLRGAFHYETYLLNHFLNTISRMTV